LSTLPDRFRALRELRSLREALLFAYLVAFAAAVPLLLRFPLPRMAALVTHPVRARGASEDEAARLWRLMELAVQFGYPLVRPGCLTRGVTLFWFMRRAGVDVELRFGLDPAVRELTEAHCWLARSGEPYGEKVDVARFTELYRLPLAA
jgi:hypothetical protein